MKKYIISAFILSIAFLAFNLIVTNSANVYAQNTVYAQGNTGVAEEDINSERFRLVICDGPAGLRQHLATSSQEYKDFIPCNFEGLMKQIQRLINVMVILGVVAALGGFSFAGYLYVTGVPGNITKAYEIFKKVGIGFVLMLSAWAIVYQILSWLTDENQFKGLLN